MTEVTKPRWSNKFSRSTVGPAIWFDREGLGDDIRGGIEVSSGVSMYSSIWSEKIFADGGVRIIPPTRSRMPAGPASECTAGEPCGSSVTSTV